METEVLQKKLLKYWRIFKSILKKVNVLMKFLAIIPARKNSKGIKNKNLKKFNKKPLIYWTIQAAKKSKCFDKIFVSTDSKIIQSFSQKQKVECPILRPKKLSRDQSNVHETIKYVIKYLKKKIIFQMQ